MSTQWTPKRWYLRKKNSKWPISWRTVSFKHPVPRRISFLPYTSKYSNTMRLCSFFSKYPVILTILLLPLSSLKYDASFLTWAPKYNVTIYGYIEEMRGILAIIPSECYMPLYFISKLGVSENNCFEKSLGTPFSQWLFNLKQ